jgi:hypothetical protein
MLDMLLAFLLPQKTETMTTKRQQAMLEAKRAPPQKRKEMDFASFVEKHEESIVALYQHCTAELQALGVFKEKKRSLDDFCDWCYAQYSSFEIVSDSESDEEDESEDEEDECEETEEESLESDVLESDDPSSFDGESASDEDEEGDEEEEETEKPAVAHEDKQ